MLSFICITFGWVRAKKKKKKKKKKFIFYYSIFFFLKYLGCKEKKKKKKKKKKLKNTQTGYKFFHSLFCLTFIMICFIHIKNNSIINTLNK